MSSAEVKISRLTPCLFLTIGLLLGACAHQSDRTADESGQPAETKDQEQTRQEERRARWRERMQTPSFDIQVESDNKHLRELVEKHNDLQRFRMGAQLDDAELQRLMRMSKDNVLNLLGAEGYFQPQIEVSRDDEAHDERPTIIIAFLPGPRTHVSEVNIQFEGDIIEHEDADREKQRKRIREDWLLQEGSDFTQARWSSSQTGALRQLIEHRYLLGKIEDSRADIQVDENRAKLTLSLASGPSFHLGPAIVDGDELYPHYLPERLSLLRTGEVYDQKKLSDAQQRLTASGYYDSAYIAIDSEDDPAAAPLTYHVTEAKRHKIQTGIGYSTDNGPRLSFEHRDNLFWGTTWRSNTTLKLNRKEPLAQFELTSLPNPNGWSAAGMIRTMRQDDDRLRTTSQTLRLGMVKYDIQYDRNFYLQYDYASVAGSGTYVAPKELVGDGAALSINYDWTGRYFNQLPVPTRGYGLRLNSSIGIALEGVRKPFLGLSGEWVGLVPLSRDSKSSRIQLRTELGAIFADRRVRLPGTYLFRTGGDRTVRGYGYRRIGINLTDGLVGPGRYLSMGSIEYQRPFLQEKYPGMLEHTFFIDVGSVANEAKHLNAHWAVGTGVRVITPVAPIELDMAYGLKTRDLRFHMNVGFYF